MHRRTYLALAGGILVAGCTGGENDVEAGTTDRASTNGSASDSGTATNAPNSETKAGTRPTSDPQLSSTVEVTSHELRTKGDGSSSAVGVLATVVNKGDSHSGRVHLKGQFYDDSGSLVGDAKADMADLAPGETWQAYVPYEGNDAGSIAEHAVSGSVDPVPQFNPSGLKIQEMKLDVTDDKATIRGTIANEGDQAADYVQAVGFFHKSKHTVLDSNSASVDGLKSGETWSFEIDSGMPAFRREQIASQTMAVTDSSF